MTEAIAHNTHSTYRTGVQCYLNFCHHVRLQPFPLSELTLQRFVACQAFRLAHRTIKVYLAGIQFWSTSMGANTFMHQMPRLYYTMRAIRRRQGSSACRPRRLPITIHHLRRIHRSLSGMHYNRVEQAMFRAASSLAFFGLLRVSEYTSSQRHSFDPEYTLLRSDVRFNSEFTIMYITIKASKTDPFRQGCTIRLAKLVDPLCPIFNMRAFLSVRPRTSPVLFSASPQSFLIRQDMVNLIRNCGLGINFNTHSFRIGGASAAAAAGIADSQIQILGRWSSNAYRRYLHLSDDAVRDLGFALLQGRGAHRVWDPNEVLGAVAL